MGLLDEVVSMAGGGAQQQNAALPGLGLVSQLFAAVESSGLGIGCRQRVQNSRLLSGGEGRGALGQADRLCAVVNLCVVVHGQNPRQCIERFGPIRPQLRRFAQLNDAAFRLAGVRQAAAQFVVCLG